MILLGAPPPTPLQQLGALTTVRVFVPEAFAGPNQGVEIPAMVDTGASASAIDTGVARSLGLPQTGVAPVGGVGGISQLPIFSGAVDLGRGGVFDPIELIGSPTSGQFKFLIGRDILASMTLVYDGPSGTWALRKEAGSPLVGAVGLSALALVALHFGGLLRVPFIS